MVPEHTPQHSFDDTRPRLYYLYTGDQFDVLNKEFGKCVGERREFRGDFGQFRQRHQAISRSVHEADRFLMISNGANFCCQVVTIILILYSTIFYRDNTISLDFESTVLYVAWLGLSVFGLALAAGQAIMVNYRASIPFIYLWPPYVIRQAIIFLPCGFYLLSLQQIECLCLYFHTLWP